MRRSGIIFRRFVVPVFAGACHLSGMMSGAYVVAQQAHHVPAVGDIVTFAGDEDEPGDGAARLIVHRQDQLGCVLDLNVLRRSGGSMVIEGRIGESSRYQVHWAGQRTAADAGDCGDHADLVIDDPDLTTLAFAAGGYGAGAFERATFISYAGG